MSSLKQKITDFCKSHETLAEILRFVIVGGFATVIDFLTMGFTELCIEREKYESILNVFFDCPKLKTSTVVIGTACGFIAGVIFNYILSIVFVFSTKGDGKSAKGFLKFVSLNLIGLGIHVGGMYLLYNLAHLNQWVVKIALTLLVLSYNYITRKVFIFREKGKKISATEQSETNV